VLIEPQRHAYQELCKNYHTHPQLILKNVAIADKPGERTLYSFDPEDPDLPTWLGQMASFNRRFLEKFLPSLPPHRRADFNALIVEHTVPCITVAQAVEELGVEGVELVQIDAEGYDWEIVRTIDLSGPMPYVVRYESRHLSEDDTAACLAHLSSHGFKIIPDGHDTIAYRRPTLPV
jgi:FkbM family methyltransferase